MQVTGNQQVMLAVRFAEVARDVVKQIGANTDILFQNGDVSIFGGFGTGPIIDPLSFGAAGAAASFGDLTLNTVLDALEEQGVVKTLAEPNLIALSGDTASFLAGGEFPIPVGQDRTGTGIDITIEFKEFGVSLSFTPTVLSDDLINLELFTEVSAIDERTAVIFDNLRIPGLTTRRARTTVELGDGQSFAIAGLLRDDFSNELRKYPFLGDVPLLGNLFRSQRYQLNQTELVVIVTPYLVQPAPLAALRAPTDFFVAPTDVEFFLQGQVFGTSPNPRRPARAQWRRRRRRPLWIHPAMNRNLAILMLLGLGLAACSNSRRTRRARNSARRCAPTWPCRSSTPSRPRAWICRRATGSGAA
jgi:pilus assembly protein CpaC